MIIQEALKKYLSIEIDLLLSHVLGKPKEFLYLRGADELTRRQADELTRMVKRREKGEPVAYLLGYKDFCGLRFEVNKDVLIPRPETEGLVERVVQALALLKKQAEGLRYKAGRQIKILDLGTGSGAIIISVYKGLRAKGLGLSYEFVASDISAKALKVAKANDKNLFPGSALISRRMSAGSIKFVHSDLFENIDGKFDVIVANLPYVPLKLLHRFIHHKQKLAHDDPFQGLKYEPAFALTDGSSSWQIYRRFFEQVGAHLSPISIIYLETDPASRKFIERYQKKYLPARQIKFYKDLNHFWRYAEIKIKR